MTVLKGRLNPEIDDVLSKHYNTVESETPSKWETLYTDKKLSDKHMQYHNDFQTSAFVVIKADTLRYEYYGEGLDTFSLTNSWSMSKSVISLLISCAVEDGLIESINDLVGNYIDEYKDNSMLTIKHLLMMSSGINHDESYINPFYYPARALYGNDLKKLIAKYHMTDTPGIKQHYKSGDTQLLAFILKKVTNKSISDYASEKIWSRIAAEKPAKWDLDKENGTEKAFCCLQSNARDFARLGQLMLNNGIWNGDTIISPKYISDATTKSDLIYKYGEDSRPYGYQFWILNQPGYEGYYFRGFKGQYIMVLPKEQLVIVRLGRKEPFQPKVPYFVDLLEYIDMARSIVP